MPVITCPRCGGKLSSARGTEYLTLELFTALPPEHRNKSRRSRSPPGVLVLALLVILFLLVLLIIGGHSSLASAIRK